MRHHFEKRNIPSGKAYVEESCVCGAISRRDIKGRRLYLYPDGSYSVKPIPHDSAVQDAEDAPLVVVVGNKAYFNFRQNETL